jgi:hypothetical protein
VTWIFPDGRLAPHPWFAPATGRADIGELARARCAIVEGMQRSLMTTTPDISGVRLLLP